MNKPNIHVVVSTTEREVRGMLWGVSLQSVVVKHADSVVVHSYDAPKSIALGAAHLLGKQVVVKLNRRSAVRSVEKESKK